MGIRFFCPQGHKLNVKEFQAGRKGICPDCGSKMQIPLESTRPSARRSQSQPPEVEVEVAEQESVGGAAQPIQPPPPLATPAADAPDPLTEAADAVWYVRPTSGGQFGPAGAEVMRTWLAEGRIAAETLVWREGWRDWREAGGVFPQLTPAAQCPGLQEIITEPTPPTRPVWTEKKRSAERSTQYIFAGGLALAVLLLFAILLLVLGNQ